MALIRFGNGVTEMRGSIAGTTFSRARGGAIARSRTSPINPNTLAQAAVRTRFADVVAAWSGIAGKPTVDEWNTFAQGVELLNRLGEAYTPSGRQMFLAVNLARQSAGLAISVALPSSTNQPEPPSQITEITAESTGGILGTLETNVLTAEANTRVLIDMTPPLDPAITNVENLYRRIATFAPTATAQDLLTAYDAAFPGSAGPPDNVIYWRARQFTVTNPILSAYVYGASIVTDV